MSINKMLNEMSKPVAWLVKGAQGKYVALDNDNGGMGMPLYPQGYVSILLTAIEEAQKGAVYYCNLNAQKNERIAELESIATDYADRFQKAQDAAKHLIVMNDADKAEIAHLKALLAKPLKIPHPDLFDNDEVPDVVISVTSARLRAQGFSVERETFKC